jgi:hypothetical protein
MHVSADASPITQTTGCTWPGETRLSTKNPDHYRPVNLNGIIDVTLACEYERHYSKIIERFRLIADTGTGATLLRDIAALSRHGVQLAIGPRDDDIDRRTHAHADGVGTTVDGQPLWDISFSEPGLYRDFYPRLISDLARVRNLAMEQVWPDIPPLREKDIEKAFLAELATRAVPALAEPGFWPTRPGLRTELDPLCPPKWRDPVSFDTLEQLAPAWVSRDFTPHRRDAVDILKTVQSVPMGECLLNELGVYARSNAMMLAHRSGRGLHGVHYEADKTVVWCFDRDALEQRGREYLRGPQVLTVQEARACGAYLELQMVCEKLQSKLDLTSLTDHTYARFEQFRQELLEKRPSSVGSASFLSTVVEFPSEEQAVPSAPVGVPGTAESPATAAPGSASKRNRVGQWIGSKARRTLASVGGRPASPPVIPPRVGVPPNVYTREPLGDRGV